MVHKGHRARLRSKLSKGSLEPHELLELILFNALPRVNTNEIAHALIQKCGGIARVFNSSESFLTEVDGVGENTAMYIRAIAQLMSVCATDICDTDKLAASERELSKYTVGLFLGQYREKTYMLMFSSRDKFIGDLQIGDGFYFQNQIKIFEAVGAAKRNRAKSVVIVHNHPNNVPLPSDTDIATSKKIDIAFGSENISVKHHCIVANNDLIFFTDKVREDDRA